MMTTASQIRKIVSTVYTSKFSVTTDKKSVKDTWKITFSEINDNTVDTVSNHLISNKYTAKVSGPYVLVDKDCKDIVDPVSIEKPKKEKTKTVKTPKSPKPKNGVYETEYGNTCEYAGGKKAFDLDMGEEIPIEMVDFSKYIRPL